MTQQTVNSAGFVSLIGAGPGDPGLITVMGLDRLKHADAVVYDALANPKLLAHAKPGARLIDAGKRGGEHKLAQEQTNQLLVDLAGEGLRVARLKGGDPYLFGRGAEEAAFLVGHGIGFEVIPGITSGIAAPAYAGIPVTHRRVASTVTFVTGHQDPAKQDSSVDYRSLVGLIAAGGTVCFYMGIGRLPEIVAGLKEHGLSADTPSAVVQWGTWAKQRSVRSGLGEIQALIKEHSIGPPAIILVGQVAALDEPGLSFFTSRPLFGKRILVTRTRQQASRLAVGLQELGAEVIEAPTIRVVPPADWCEVDQAIRGIAGWDWLILTSPNAVGVLADRLQALSLDARQLAGVRVAAVGDATAEALENRLGIRPDFVPRRAMGEALGQELIDTHGMADQAVLLFRADIARPGLPGMLADAGAGVTEIAAYQTVITDALPEEALEALRCRVIDWVTFTSSSTVSNLVTLLGTERTLLDGVQTASIGPVTSEAMRDVGLGITVEAQRSNVPGLIDAIRGQQGR